MRAELNGKTVVMGITGGIAAYKAAEVCSTLVKSGADVHVIMTRHARRFVAPATFSALTHNRVVTGLFEEPEKYEIQHVSLSERADVMLIAPATANIIGKMASGIADDMLSTTVMAATCPVILAPAMNARMWGNAVVRENVKKLESVGYRFVGPISGRLACGEVGAGRMSDCRDILAEVARVLVGRRDLEGISILVTAGPTEEPIDAVRFIANRSSGKMGYAIAQAASRRGADVILVSGPTSLTPPAGVEFISVRTAAEMLNSVMVSLPRVRCVVGAAAVADYTPVSPASGKLKKTSRQISVQLVATADIVAEVGKQKGDRILIAFAAETDDLLDNAREKLRAKNADMIVANDVSRSDIGFGADENQVTIIEPGSEEHLPKLPKSEVAERILDHLKKALVTSGAA